MVDTAEADVNPSTAGGRADLYRRAFDLTVSSILLLLVLPVLLATALLSAAALRSWPFFTQDRIGSGGQSFRFVKVRTLPARVPPYVDKHQLAQYSVPAVCRAMRKLHLDELPQLVLVVRGRMSLVGPRPEMAHLHEAMGAFGVERTAVRPGCTGLWQISEACDGLIGDTPEYDRFYLRARCLRLDLWILVRTALQMVGLSGAVTLDDIPAWVPAAAPDDGVRTVIDLTGEPARDTSFAVSR